MYLMQQNMIKINNSVPNYLTTRRFREDLFIDEKVYVHIRDNSFEIHFLNKFITKL